MDKFKGILLCSDLDGTLRNSKAEISKENISAIKYFMDNGGRFTLCTGRSKSYIRELEKEGLIFNSPLVVLNGAMIYDPFADKILYDNPMDKEKLGDFQTFLDETRDMYVRYDCHASPDVNLFEEVGEKPLYKIVFIFDDEKKTKDFRKILEKRYKKDFFITNSWNTGLEIMAKDSTKGHALKIIKNYIDEEIKITVCTGDYENDLTMFRTADFSYAVGNAIDEIKKEADFVVCSNDDHAICDVVKHIEENLIK